MRGWDKPGVFTRPAEGPPLNFVFLEARKGVEVDMLFTLLSGLSARQGFCDGTPARTTL